MRGWRADTSHEARAFSLLKAYAAGNDTGASPWLRHARPAFAGEYDYLTKEWPELAEFVASQKEIRLPLPAARVVPEFIDAKRD